MRNNNTQNNKPVYNGDRQQHHHHHHNQPRNSNGEYRPRGDNYPQNRANEYVENDGSYMQYLRLKQQFESGSNTNVASNTVTPDNFQPNPVSAGDYASFEEQAQYGNEQNTTASGVSDFSAEESKYARWEKMEDYELAQPAKVKFNKISFDAGRSVAPIKLMGKDGRALNNGDLVYTIQNGHLVPNGGHMTSDIMAARNDPQKRVARNDLVKSLTVTITGKCNKKLLLSFPTVGKIAEEFSRNDADHVNFVIPAGALNSGKPVRFEVLNRTITNGMIAFASVFNSAAPDMMDKTIQHCVGRGFSLVPYNHSIVHYYNKDHMDDGLAILSPDNEWSDDARMSTEECMKYLEIAKKNVAKNISLGNVTTDFAVRLGVIEPTDYTKSLQNYQTRLSSNSGLKEGDLKKPVFNSFADAKFMLGGNATEEQIRQYMNTEQTFDIIVEAEYVKLSDERPIEMLDH